MTLSISFSQFVNSFLAFKLMNIASCFWQTTEILEEMVETGSENMNVRDKDEVITRMRSSVASKQFGQEEKLCPLIAEVNIWFLLFHAML